MNPRTDSYVLDASGLLVSVKQESGIDVVEAAIDQGCAMSTVNLSEVMARMLDLGRSPLAAIQWIESVPLTVYPFDRMQAYQAGLLRPRTRSAGLSFGDRACVALAQTLRLPVLTADRAWATLDLDVTIHLIR